MVDFIDAEAAAGLVANGDTVLFGGSGGGHAVPEAVIEALADRYKSDGEPKGLTLVSVVSLGDWESTGFNHLAEPGLAKRVISGGFNNCPRFAAMAIADEIEGYTLPQGVLSQLCRDMAAGRPGLLTRTGLHTFVDPRQAGGRQSECAKEDLVDLITIDGEEFLLYKSFKVNVAVIRGTTADENGNISMEDEAFYGENFSMAAAAHLHGGITIAQVKQVASAGTLNGRHVKVPGAVVDYVVVEPEQRQTYLTRHSAAYAGDIRLPDRDISPIPFDVRKVIARRGAMELFPGAIVNLGFGVSNGISAVAAEEGFYREVTLTVEQGIIGGVPAVGKNAGAGVNYDMMADQPLQFDFYDGGGLDLAFLSFAEVDADGNVNVSRYGKSVNGPGGFINIAQGARTVIFSGTLTASGLDIVPEDGKLSIRSEGKIKKWVPKVGQITFNGRFALEQGQTVLYITERAVFRMTPEGIRLEEVAPGMDLQRDVLDQIGFDVIVPEKVKEMDPAIFHDAKMGLAGPFRDRAARGGGDHE